MTWKSACQRGYLLRGTQPKLSNIWWVDYFTASPLVHRSKPLPRGHIEPIIRPEISSLALWYKSFGNAPPPIYSS
jgi:hypothetical protein